MTLARAVEEYLFLTALLQASPSEYRHEHEADLASTTTGTEAGAEAEPEAEAEAEKEKERRHERALDIARSSQRAHEEARARGLVLAVPSAQELSASSSILATAIRRHLRYHD